MESIIEPERAGYRIIEIDGALAALGRSQPDFDARRDDTDRPSQSSSAWLTTWALVFSMVLSVSVTTFAIAHLVR